MVCEIFKRVVKMLKWLVKILAVLTELALPREWFAKNLMGR